MNIKYYNCSTISSGEEDIIVNSQESDDPSLNLHLSNVHFVENSVGNISKDIGISKERDPVMFITVCSSSSDELENLEMVDSSDHLYSTEILKSLQSEKNFQDTNDLMINSSEIREPNVPINDGKENQAPSNTSVPSDSPCSAVYSSLSISSEFDITQCLLSPRIQVEHKAGVHPCLDNDDDIEKIIASKEREQVVPVNQTSCGNPSKRKKLDYEAQLSDSTYTLYCMILNEGALITMKESIQYLKSNLIKEESNHVITATTFVESWNEYDRFVPLPKKNLSLFDEQRAIFLLRKYYFLLFLQAQEDSHLKVEKLKHVIAEKDIYKTIFFPLICVLQHCSKYGSQRLWLWLYDQLYFDVLKTMKSIQVEKFFKRKIQSAIAPESERPFENVNELDDSVKKKPDGNRYCILFEWLYVQILHLFLQHVKNREYRVDLCRSILQEQRTLIVQKIGYHAKANLLTDLISLDSDMLYHELWDIWLNKTLLIAPHPSFDLLQGIGNKESLMTFMTSLSPSSSFITKQEEIMELDNNLILLLQLLAHLPCIQKFPENIYGFLLFVGKLSNSDKITINSAFFLMTVCHQFLNEFCKQNRLNENLHIYQSKKVDVFSLKAACMAILDGPYAQLLRPKLFNDVSKGWLDGYLKLIQIIFQFLDIFQKLLFLDASTSNLGLKKTITNDTGVVSIEKWNGFIGKFRTWLVPGRRIQEKALDNRGHYVYSIASIKSFCYFSEGLASITMLLTGSNCFPELVLQSFLKTIFSLILGPVGIIDGIRPFSSKNSSLSEIETSNSAHMPNRSCSSTSEISTDPLLGTRLTLIDTCISLFSHILGKEDSQSRKLVFVAIFDHVIDPIVASYSERELANRGKRMPPGGSIAPGHAASTMNREWQWANISAYNNFITEQSTLSYLLLHTLTRLTKYLHHCCILGSFWPFLFNHQNSLLKALEISAFFTADFRHVVFSFFRRCFKMIVPLILQDSSPCSKKCMKVPEDSKDFSVGPNFVESKQKEFIYNKSTISHRLDILVQLSAYLPWLSNFHHKFIFNPLVEYCNGHLLGSIKHESNLSTRSRAGVVSHLTLYKFSWRHYDEMAQILPYLCFLLIKLSGGKTWTEFYNLFSPSNGKYFSILNLKDADIPGRLVSYAFNAGLADIFGHYQKSEFFEYVQHESSPPSTASSISTLTQSKSGVMGPFTVMIFYRVWLMSLLDPILQFGPLSLSTEKDSSSSRDNNDESSLTHLRMQQYTSLIKYQSKLYNALRSLNNPDYPYENKGHVLKSKQNSNLSCFNGSNQMNCNQLLMASSKVTFSCSFEASSAKLVAIEEILTYLTGPEIRKQLSIDSSNAYFFSFSDLSNCENNIFETALSLLTLFTNPFQYSPASLYTNKDYTTNSKYGGMSPAIQNYISFWYQCINFLFNFFSTNLRNNGSLLFAFLKCILRIPGRIDNQNNPFPGICFSYSPSNIPSSEISSTYGLLSLAHFINQVNGSGTPHSFSSSSNDFFPLAFCLSNLLHVSMANTNNTNDGPYSSRNILPESNSLSSLWVNQSLFYLQELFVYIQPCMDFIQVEKYPEDPYVDHVCNQISLAFLDPHLVNSFTELHQMQSLQSCQRKFVLEILGPKVRAANYRGTLFFARLLFNLAGGKSNHLTFESSISCNLQQGHPSYLSSVVDYSLTSKAVLSMPWMDLCLEVICLHQYPQLDRHAEMSEWLLFWIRVWLYLQTDLCLNTSSKSIPQELVYVSSLNLSPPNSNFTVVCVKKLIPILLGGIADCLESIVLPMYKSPIVGSPLNIDILRSPSPFCFHFHPSPEILSILLDCFCLINQSFPGLPELSPLPLLVVQLKHAGIHLNQLYPVVL